MSSLLDADIHLVLLERQIEFRALTSPDMLKALVACVHRAYLYMCEVQGLLAMDITFPSPLCRTHAEVMTPWSFVGISLAGGKLA